MTAKTLEDAMAQNHAALDAMVKGDSSGYVARLSDRDDVTWSNPSTQSTSSTGWLALRRAMTWDGLYEVFKIAR
jgi:hypothetical protein